MRTIRNFKLVEQIGSGGMGVIWRAVQTSLDRPVALKELHPHIARDKEFITRFEREAKSAAALEHENIVGVIDFGRSEEEGEGWFIAMELVDGPDLRSLLDKEPRVPAPVAISIVLDVLRGLEAAHARGIVHRDMKPANILLTKDGVAKVADFSVAQSSTTPSVTTTGAMLGTPAYMSPEQALGQQTLDARSDVFAVGSILYEILSGQRAFEGPTYPAILSAVLHAEPLRLEATGAGVPPSIARVVRRAMEKTLTLRYASAAELARDLEIAAREENIPFSRRIVADWMRDPKGLGDSIRRRQAQERLERGQRLAEKAQAELQDAFDALAAAVALDPTNAEARQKLELLRASMPRDPGTVRLPELGAVATGESIGAPPRAEAPRVEEPRAKTPTPTDGSFRMQPASVRFVLWGGWALAAIALSGLLLSGLRTTGAGAVKKRALAIRETESAENAFAWIEEQIDRRPELEPRLRETRAVLETEMLIRERTSRHRPHDIAWEQTRKYSFAAVPFTAANVLADGHVRGSVLGLYREALKRDPRLATDPRVLDAVMETLSIEPPSPRGYSALATDILKEWYPEERKAFARAHAEARGATLLNAAAILEETEKLPEWLGSLLAYAREENMEKNEAILREVQGRDAQIYSAIAALAHDGDVHTSNVPRVTAFLKELEARLFTFTGPAATIDVFGWPSGKVFVDGVEVSPALPVRRWKVPPGKHTVRVAGADYDETCDLTLKAGDAGTVHYWHRREELECD